MVKWLITNWLPVTTISGLFGLLASNVYFNWTSNIEAKNKQTSKETIDLLQEKIDAMKLVQEELKTKQEEMSTQIDQLTKTNTEQAEELRKYILIFQGRDPDTLSFQSRALTALEQVGKIVPIITENYQLSLDNGTKIDTLCAKIEELISVRKVKKLKSERS